MRRPTTNKAASQKRCAEATLLIFPKKNFQKNCVRFFFKKKGVAGDTYVGFRQIDRRADQRACNNGRVWRKHVRERTSPRRARFGQKKKPILLNWKA